MLRGHVNLHQIAGDRSLGEKPKDNTNLPAIHILAKNQSQ